MCRSFATLCVVATLLCACGAPPPSDETSDTLLTSQSALCADGPTVEGVDVSRFQGTINWAALKTSGKVFAIIQAGRGTSVDPKFAVNMREARANGFIVGTYLRFFPGQDVAAQAKILIDAAGKDRVGEMPPMLDVEDMDGLPTATVVARVTDFTQRVAAGTGRTPMIYTGYYFWRDNIRATNFGKYPLSIANYSNNCPPIPAGWARWTLHQYTSSARLPGITENTVDVNRFNGTLAQLQAFVAGGTDSTQGTLTGTLHSGGEGGKLVAGATVKIGDVAQTTGADGLFSFRLPAGAHNIIVSKDGYVTQSLSRSVAAGQTSSESIILVPDGSVPIVEEPTTPGISGTVFRSDDLSKVSGAKLEFKDSSGKVLAVGESDALGSFHLDVDTAPASGMLTISQDGFNERKVPTNIPEDKRVELDVVLDLEGMPDSQLIAVGVTGCSAAGGLELWMLCALAPVVLAARRRQRRG